MMNRLLLLVFVLCSVSTSAQTSKTLQQHRLQYKADLYDNIKADTSKVDFYPFKKQFLLTAAVVVLKDQPVFMMTTSSGIKKEAQKYARITFYYTGKHFTLYAYQLTKLKESKDYADNFFIPFRDATTGKTTYEAGRYLDFKTGDVNQGKLIIDFNKAYNPYCAFTDGYNCPIPPAENTLKLAVTAGEKKYRGIR